MATLGVACIGPRYRGRSYGVLSHSLSGRELDAVRPMLEDFGLALAAWSEHEQSTFVAQFRLSGGQDGAYGLCRAHYLGQADLGAIALANVVVIPSAVMKTLGWRTHPLLKLVPIPNDATFGDTRVTLPSKLASPRTETPPFGLEWRDFVVETGPDAKEQILADALDSIRPAVQLARVDGWATTDLLEPSGGFDPENAFRLLVREVGAKSRVPAGRLTAVATAQGLEVAGGVPPPPPAARRATDLVNRVAMNFPGAGEVIWSPGMADLPLRDVIFDVYEAVTANLESRERGQFLWALAQSSTDVADLRADVLAVATECFLSLVHAAASPAEAAARLEQALEGIDLGDDEARVSSEVIRRVALTGVLTHLSPTGLHSAWDSGLLNRVSGSGGKELLGSLSPPQWALLLERSLAWAKDDPESCTLAAVLVRRLSDQGEDFEDSASDGLALLLEVFMKPGVKPGLSDAATIALAAPAPARLAARLPQKDRYGVGVLKFVIDGQHNAGRPMPWAATADAMKAAMQLLEAQG